MPMTNLQLQWKTQTAKFDALSKRERAIAFMVALLVIVLGVNNFFIEPQLAKKKALSVAMEQERAQMSAIQAEIAQRIAGKAIDPDAESKKKIKELQQQLAQVDSGLKSIQTQLVPPEKMASLLEDILHRNRRLQLISLKSLPVSNVLEESENKKAKSDQVNPPLADTGEPKKASKSVGAIYKHELVLEVQGNYLDMLAYLKELETLPQQVYWSQAQMQVEQYPRARLSLHVFTLSLDAVWLN